jgi:ribosomal protein L37AE/L43A
MDVGELMKSTREERLAEVGTEPPCPFCRRPRVSRSSYVRCNPCGINWLNEEMDLPNYMERDPRVVRSEAARTVSGMKPTADTKAEDASAA